MTSKLIEIRDKATFIPAMIVRLDPVNEMECWLLARAGYGLTHEVQSDYVVLCQINGGNGYISCDPYVWHNRTYRVVHEYCIKHFDEITSGDVVDVEFILGITSVPKVSERAV